MAKKALTVLGVSLVGLGSLFTTTPAQAAVTDCGTAPTGGHLTWDSTPGVCELTFDTAGTYNWTPSEIVDLQGLIVGAGGGALVAAYTNGYSGNGGEVKYLDLSQLSAVSPFTIIVGAGGTTSDTPTAGGLTSVTVGSGTPSANGGSVGSMSNGFCALNGSYSTYLGMGNGAGGNASEGGGGICGTAGPGISLTSSNLDSAGTSVTSLFSNYAGSFGKGGNLTANGAVDAAGVGQGGNIAVDLVGDVFTGQTNGGAGLAVFRWTPSQIATTSNGGTSDGSTLASTGTNDGQLALMAAGLIALGLAFTTIKPRARIRTKADSKH